MNSRYLKRLGFGLAGIALAVLPLSGCTSSSFGGPKTFATSNQEIAVLPASANYTADGALIEARTHFRNDNFGYSTAYYKKAVELSPNEPEGYIGLGASYDRLGRFDLADRVYKALYEITGGTVQYYNNVGYSYMLRGNLRASLVNFRKASELDPDNVVVLNNIQMLSDAATRARA